MTQVAAVRFDTDLAEPVMLSKADAEEVRSRCAALGSLLKPEDNRATYKLELLFGTARSTRNSTPGILSFWGNGNKLHGGGDDKLYLCPGSSLGVNGCCKPIPDAFNEGHGATCPHCGSTWRQEQLIGEVMLNLPMRKWAEVLLHYYRVCDFSCDLYLKHAPDDVRAVSRAQAEHATWANSKKLEAVRKKRVRYIYTAANIIKDTSAGADLLSRFYAFLTA